jgi:hypothetical protein
VPSFEAARIAGYGRVCMLGSHRSGRSPQLNTTPDQVADAFRTMRKELLGEEPVSRRSLTERAANLAVFAAQHATGYTCNEARTIWNRQHRKTPADQFTDSDKFKRATRSAYRRITGTDLDWTGIQPNEPTINQPKET